MPAPREALEAMRTGVSQGMEAGLAYEREAVGRLATSPACRNLIHLFLQREEARKLPAGCASRPDRSASSASSAPARWGPASPSWPPCKGCEVVVQEVNADALGAGLDADRRPVPRRPAANAGLLSVETGDAA